MAEACGWYVTRYYVSRLLDWTRPARSSETDRAYTLEPLSGKEGTSNDDCFLYSGTSSEDNAVLGRAREGSIHCPLSSLAFGAHPSRQRGQSKVTN